MTLLSHEEYGWFFLHERPSWGIPGDDRPRNLHRTRIGAVMMTETVLFDVFATKGQKRHGNLPKCTSRDMSLLAMAAPGHRERNSSVLL